MGQAPRTRSPSHSQSKGGELRVDAQTKNLVKEMDEANVILEKMEGGDWAHGSKNTLGPISREEDQSYGMTIPVCDLYGGWEEANSNGILCAKNVVPSLLCRASDTIESQAAKIERLKAELELRDKVIEQAIDCGGIGLLNNRIYAYDGKSLGSQNPELYAHLAGRGE